MDNYLSLNKASWDNRLEAHLASDFYDVENFLKGKSSLNDIELDLIGDISGKSILHLQCHFGQDSISLSRMDAQVTGVDLSDKSIAKAKALATEIGADTQFVCSDIYDLPNNLQGQFDMVFTTYGTISWLPDLDKWAQVINHFLKPGGSFVFVEFHPVVWMFDDDLDKVAYDYFNKAPLVETETGTYADRDSAITSQHVCWNHGLAEVATALLGQSLQIQTLKEYDYAPYPFVAPSIESTPGKYHIKHMGNKIPLVYSIVATKPTS